MATGPGRSCVNTAQLRELGPPLRHGHALRAAGTAPGLACRCLPVFLVRSPVPLDAGPPATHDPQLKEQRRRHGHRPGALLV
ncbi:hypothetical protein KAM330_47970 (plasmid) [Aeromonas hydrophila]|nr:hypothetical protein KAM330_47970 [Aeromonas hydrophila]